MALSKNSKILIDDINTALSGKIDSAGTGLTKSGTSLTLSSLHSAGGTIGASENGTLGFGGPFTMPYVTYDAYGRVTGGGVRTITMPSAPSGGTATAMSTSGCGAKSAYTITLPSGGTWAYITDTGGGTKAGGSTIVDRDRESGSGYALYIKIV